MAGKKRKKETYSARKAAKESAKSYYGDEGWGKLSAKKKKERISHERENIRVGRKATGYPY